MADCGLSVVIPNWNGKRFLATCLDSLRRQSHTSVTIIVVDNASSDGSQAFISDCYPEVRLIELASNHGFTGACNIGIRAADSEIIALLNNDTEVDQRWASELVSAFAARPDVGIVASKMLLFDQRDRLHTAGDYFTVDGRAGNRGAWERDEGQYDVGEYVFSACGGAAAYRRSMLAHIGALDDDFFFLLEDADLAWRAQLALDTGYGTRRTPSSIITSRLPAAA